MAHFVPITPLTIPRNKEGFITMSGSADLLARPPKGATELIAASQACTWAEAQREWDYTGETREDGDPGFPDACGFCGERNIRTAHQVQNRLNGHTRWLGSECIKRYLILGGVETLEDSQRLFQHQVKRAATRRALADIGLRLLSEEYPPWEDLTALPRLLCRYYDVRSLVPILYDRWEDMLSLVLGAPPDAFFAGDVERVRAAILEPRTLVPPGFQPPRQPRGLGSWGTQRRQRTRVTTTLSATARQRGADREDES
jgi:hypothetical protein